MAEPLGVAPEVVIDTDSGVVSLEIGKLPSKGTTKPCPAEEQALESHEVIELQTFSDRKAWIDEKIKFLESLPPIDIFAGLEDIRSSSENVSGLPSILELQQWVAEHDAIEKETEIFDTGELTKLRQLTKAATQRNLSSEDTDVIELTLTTIYGLDKLLHLLRDRSENLEMMAIRLAWEENRQRSWKERRQIIEDLEAFCVNRARWSPAIYDANLHLEDSHVLPRRSSIASLASAGSDNSSNSLAFSRSTRFKLAEILARDAAQFSGRVTSLRHGKVAAAGKALDKLIDHSRKPVPEDLLDEQDRLEDKCINEMENISKFTMDLVMQWRKADEIYVETMKDHTAASNLLEEIETAKLYHPTSRQSTSFASRIDTILKRLAVRADPLSAANVFLRPEHILLPDQNLANDKLARSLSADMENANRLARKVDLVAKDYRASYDAVKRVENMKISIGDISSTLTSILMQLKDGVSSDLGDGSPPDLTSERCLDPTAHSNFLAFLPSLLQSSKSAIGNADELLKFAPSALLCLDRQGIDTQFRDDAGSVVNRLSSLRDEVAEIQDSISKRVMRLQEARKISSKIDSKFAFVKELTSHIVESLKQEQWQLSTAVSQVAPSNPTPPRIFELESQLLQMSSAMKADVQYPLEALIESLEHRLLTLLKEKFFSLQASLEGSFRMLRLLRAITEQSTAMAIIQDQFHEILAQINDSAGQIKQLIEAASNVDLAENTIETFPGPPDFDNIQTRVANFNNNLVHQVKFVAQQSIPLKNVGPLAESISPTGDISIPVESHLFVGLPFDPASLDANVRADSNRFSMQLNGGIENLKNLQKHLKLVRMKETVDSSLKTIHHEINTIIHELSCQKESFAMISRDDVDRVNLLHAMIDFMAALNGKCSNIDECLFSLRGLLRKMDDLSNNTDPATREALYLSTNDTANEAELSIKGWIKEANTFRDIVSVVLKDAQEHQEFLKMTEDRWREQEEARLAAEAEERLRLEKERIEEEEEEEKRRLLEEIAAEQQREDIERQRKEVELANQERIAQEAAEVLRIQKEIERLAKEKAERIRIEQERAEMVERLRVTEAQLEEERLGHARREVIVVELEREMESQMDHERKQGEAPGTMEKQAHRQQFEELPEQQRAQIEQFAEEETGRGKQAEEQHLARPLSSPKGKDVDVVQVLARKEQPKQQCIAEEGLDQVKINEPRKTGATGFHETLEQQQEEKHKPSKHLGSDSRTALIRLHETGPTNQGRAVENNGGQLLLDERQNSEKPSKIGSQKPSETLQDDVAVGRRKQEQTNRENEVYRTDLLDESDVFGCHVTPNMSGPPPRSQELLKLHSQLMVLRKRLRSIGINDARHPSKPSTSLPTITQYKKMLRDLLAISADFQEFPPDTQDTNINIDLKTLKTDIEAAFISLIEIEKLAHLHEAVQACDAALSDLLEHIDSYPAVPLSVLSSPHRSALTALPEEQLSSRLDFTRNVVDEMVTKSASVIDDSRTRSEHSRIHQTWVELEEMANDRINGNKSRPGSAFSGNSSRSDHNSFVPIPRLPALPRGAKKKGSYTNLSVSSTTLPSKGKMLAPPLPPTKSRRTQSGVNDVANRSTSRLSSVSSNRSVSGPLSTTLHGSTFASRQRTTSLTSSMATPVRPPSLSASRFRIASESKRGPSPSMSEKSAHSHSRSSLAPSRPSLTSSTWSRAPRNSLSSLLHHPSVVTPQAKADSHTRNKYVANPKSKLDMAVGDVVNQLSVGINIEGITESWRDQSGKYWIGNQDPKLCFCRILRSQTVMVRVGGGWTELSKFIKDHFADSFRIAPDSPRMGAQEKQWISSATLLQSQDHPRSPPRAPQTPEPMLPFVPSFSLMTPSGQSPHSLKSSPSGKGSPLTPLQFLRRAEPDQSNNLLRPVTPSKPPLRGRVSNANTPARTSIWRP